MRAIRELSDADMARLGSVAKLRTRGLLNLDWEDALHEAFARSIDGTRRWPRDIPFVIFVREAIRSITSEAWRVQARESRRRSDSPVEIAAGDLASEALNPEQIALERDTVAELVDLFSGDSVALGILQGLAEGATPDEMQSRLGLTKVDYDSARRRIRRRVSHWTGIGDG